MLGGGARINLIFGRSCGTRFARVRGEKRFSNQKGDLSQIFELWLPGLGNILIFLRISTAFTRPAGLDLVSIRCISLIRFSKSKLAGGERFVYQKSMNQLSFVS